MPYPDHFNTHAYNIEEVVWEVPYKLMLAWGKEAKDMQDITLNKARVRTFIQGYNSINKPFVVYDNEKLLDKINYLIKALLLISDSMTYLYDGVTTDVGFIINNLATFLVYTCNYILLMLFGKCLIDYIKPNKKQRCVFCIVFICIIISLIMLVASQFFDIIYYFSAHCNIKKHH